MRASARPVRRGRARLAGAALGTWLACTPAPVLASTPGYEPPAAGSYELPPIQRAADGAVLDTDGRRRQLHEAMDGRWVVLSFIYTRCSDARGCPLATHVLHQVAAQVQRDPLLAGRVSFISLSFDPAHDTPGVMRRYAQTLVGQEGLRDWHFFTTASQRELRPILEDYGQYIVPERDAGGQSTGGFTHLLKVFLIDRQGRVRNIYGASFLSPQLLLNDLRTLALEAQGTGAKP